MGYSSPKKQLDLKDFLSQPAAPGKYRNRWTRTAATPPKSPAPEKPATDMAAETEE
jgi:hypothetical protein